MVIIAIYFQTPTLQKRIYNEMIINIAFCDLLIAIGTLMGLPNDGSILCNIQSPLINIGQVCY
jgi:hypothetical protein